MRDELRDGREVAIWRGTKKLLVIKVRGASRPCWWPQRIKMLLCRAYGKNRSAALFDGTMKSA